MSSSRVLVSLAIVISIAFCALGMPNVIQYQGKLTDNTGVGINDSLEMSFRLFNDPLVGAPLWTELHSGANKVFVHKGLFDVALGSIVPVNLPFDVTYYLEITVAGNILAPRVLLTTSPYAYRAAIADSVVGGSGGDTCLWADHSTDPLIFAKNNNDVMIRDDGDNIGDIYVNMDHSAFNSAGIYVYRDGSNNGRHVSNIYAYRAGTSGIDNGGTSWDYVNVDAAIKGYTLWGNKYTAAIAGYNWLDYDSSAAVIGAYYNGDFWGALGYSCDGNYYTGYFYGEAVHFHPMSRPLSPVLGDIYTDETTLKMYFYNGVDWVDMTATPGAGSSLWTDHATDPYIYANNNANVQVADATEDTFLTVINHDGTAIKAVGMNYPDPQYGYLGYGGECPGHPDFWSTAGVMGYTTTYVDAIYGYAADGGYGVFGVADGTDDYAGVRGYHANSMTNGRLGTQDFGGEFDPGILLIPGTAPAAVRGAIYANSTDNKLYFYNGTSWVDLTAAGGGAGQWEDAGAYKRVIGNDKLRAYESGQNLAYVYQGADGGTVDNAGLFITDWASGDASVKIGVKAIAEAYGTANAYGVYAIGRDYPGGLTGGNKYGVYAVTEWGDSNFAVYGTNLGPESVMGDYGFQVAIYGNQATGEYAGFFNGLFHIAPGTAPAAPVLGDIYTNGTDNKLYFHNGTNWVDLTGGGGGGVSGSGTAGYIPLWTPDGSTLGDSRLQQNAATTFITDDPTRQANFSVYNDETTDLHAIFASSLNGSTADGSSWSYFSSGGSGVMGMLETAGQYKAGLHGAVWSDYNANIAGVVGSNQVNSTFGALSYYNGTNWFAGFFNGDVHITGNLTVDGTYPGGGSSLWTDAGTYISANTNNLARVYDEGQTYGISYQGSNLNGIYGSTSNSNPGASGVYGYVGTSTGGTGYGYNNSIAAVKGHCFWGNDYHFGLQGDTYSNDSGSPTAGVIGTFTNDGSIWGSLAYKHTDASVWAGYFNGNVHITGDLTIDGDYLHDHWGESWTGTDPWGITLSNTTSTGPESVYVAGNGSSGIKVIHYNAIGTRAIEAYEGYSTTSYYSYGALGTLPSYTGTRGTITNAGVYGELPNLGAGGAAILGVDNNTSAPNHYAGYFVGKVKVDGSIDAGQNPFCITLTAGENLALGDVVSVSTTADLTVIKAPTDSETVIGVATEAALSGAPVRIAIGGVVQVQTSAAVTRANFVRVGTTAGQAIANGTFGNTGDFGIFLQTTAGAGLAWMTFKQAEIY